MTGLLRVIDFLSLWIFRASFVPVVGMIVVIAIEVFSRYVLNDPTAFAFDLTYMFNGAIFLFAASWTLRQNGHVRIDIIDRPLGSTGRRALDVIFYLLLCTPIFAIITYFAATSAFEAFMRGEVEVVSPWRPLIWPFQTAMAVGLGMLMLQSLGEGIRRIVDPAAPVANDHPEAL